MLKQWWCIVSMPWWRCRERDADLHSAYGVVVGSITVPTAPVALPVPLGKGAPHCDTVSVTVSVTVTGVAIGQDAPSVETGGIEVTTKEVAPVKGTFIGPNTSEVAMLKLDNELPVGWGKDPVPPMIVELGK